MGFSRFLLKSMGWTTVGGVVPENRCVILEAPHTSIWDFVIGFLYYRSVGGWLRVMIKKEAFVFPLNLLLRAMGGFPIDRSNPQATLLSIVHEMEKQGGKPVHLVICPEGTRKAIRRWKTGYHAIARGAGIPVYISFIDWKAKRVGIWGKVELTDNAREDTNRIQEIYESLNLTGKHPEGYVTR